MSEISELPTGQEVKANLAEIEVLSSELYIYIWSEIFLSPSEAKHGGQ